MQLPASPAAVLKIMSAAKGKPARAPISPANGSIISLETGKQAYSAKIRRNMAAMPYWSTKDSINDILLLTDSYKILVHCMRGKRQVFKEVAGKLLRVPFLTKVLPVGIIDLYAYIIGGNYG